MPNTEPHLHVNAAVMHGWAEPKLEPCGNNVFISWNTSIFCCCFRLPCSEGQNQAALSTLSGMALHHKLVCALHLANHLRPLPGILGNFYPHTHIDKYTFYRKTAQSYLHNTLEMESYRKGFVGMAIWRAYESKSHLVVLSSAEKPICLAAAGWLKLYSWRHLWNQTHWSLNKLTAVPPWLWKTCAHTGKCIRF